MISARQQRVVKMERQEERSQKELNGWNLEQFQSFVNTVKQHPEAGKLTFHTLSRWDEGFAVDGRTENIEMMPDKTIKRKFTLRGDHPPELLGANTGPTAVETLLAALGSCVAGTYAAHATARGIKIDELEVEIEGKIDLNGFLQLKPVRAGIGGGGVRGAGSNSSDNTDYGKKEEDGTHGLSVNIRVKSDADEKKLKEIAEVTKKASPVYDSVSNPVKITSFVSRM